MTGASLRNVLGHAKGLRIALRAAEPLCVLRNVPERSPRHAPGFPAFTALRSAARRTWLMGIRVPVAVSRFARKAHHFGVGGGRSCWGYMSLSLFRALRERRATLGRAGNLFEPPLYPGRICGAFPRHKLPSAYLRESLLVLHLQLLFQGGVKFPTGGKSGGAKGVPWRRKRACGRADEPATRVCVGSHAG